jgi:DNA (cytosine-5)-methyltransferase 1
MMKVLDLFSGIGGFSLGLERTGGFETVAFCEIQKYPRQILKQHWPDVPIFTDVKTLNKDTLNEQGISVDVICGGFPCQDISFAGKGAGLEGERSGLWFEFHRLIKEIRPSWVIAENVSALRSRGLDAVLGSLAEIGYDAEWHCIPASAVGAPHRRDRIWIVAYPNSSEQRAWLGSRQPSRDTARKRISDGSGVDSSGMVAYSDSSKCQTFNTQSGGNGESEKWQSGASCDSAFMADTDSAGLQGRQETGNFGGIWPRLQQFIERCPDSIGTTWVVEPDVGRVANGVSNRTHRLKALGNAVVPQIPELIGYAILETINNA